MPRDREDHRSGQKPPKPGTGEFSDYLHDVGNIRLLTRAEEIDLARKVQAGDRSARDTLIKHNLRLVISVARQFSRRICDLQDLISEGHFGLIRAAELYNPDFVSKSGYSIKFATYAVYWVRQAILRSLINNKPIRVPVYIYQFLKDWEEKCPRHQGEDNEAWIIRLPRKVASQRQKDNVLSALKAFSQSISIDEVPLQGRELDGLERLILKEDFEFLTQVIDTLDYRAKRILIMRYGLNNEEPLTLTEIGKIFGITRERVRQCQEVALVELAERLEYARRNGLPKGKKQNKHFLKKVNRDSL